MCTFSDGTPPTCTSNLFYMCGGGLRDYKSSNRIQLSQFVCLAPGAGQVGWGYLGWSAWVYMSSGMFRAEDFSNRIKLSQLVEDLWIFNDSGYLWMPAVLERRQMGGGIWGHGGVTRHVHMHVHGHACTKCWNKHVGKLQMSATMEAAMFIMFNMHACMCACTLTMHACACGCVQTRGVPPKSVKML